MALGHLSQLRLADSDVNNEATDINRVNIGIVAVKIDILNACADR